MNPGYLALLFVCCALILLATGWGAVLLRGVPLSTALWFMAGWAVMFGVRHSFGDGTIGLTGVWLALWSAAVLVREPPLGRLHLLSVSAVIGVSDFVSKSLLLASPIMLVYESSVDVTIVLVLLCVMLVRQPRGQFAALSLGLLLSGVVSAMSAPTDMRTLAAGARFDDQWWLAFFAARVTTVAIELVARKGRALMDGVLYRRKAGRK